MNHWKRITLLGLGMGLLALGASAQTPTNLLCSLYLLSFSTTAPNIFNDRQEQDLGDALAEMEESNLRIAAPGDDDLLTRLGERLLAALPPSAIHFRFRIYESGEINAFSTAGGRVYVSRKLITAAKNEDELAAVVAHEIGHLMTHQMAIYYTRLLRIRLGITQVGDRADIFAKFHQVMSAPPKFQEELHEEKDELVADKVSLFAVVRAGYAPESGASFFDQATSNKGKTGSWLSDTFGLTSEASQRYRATLKLAGALPAGCKGGYPQDSAAFEAWRQKIVTERLQTETENAKDDKQIKLDPPLRPQPWRVRFSPNGQYVFLQDEASINVVDRKAEKALFRIDAPDANAAQFTPDSSTVVFYDDALRVERWDVAIGKRTSVKELVVFDGCNQAYMVPDGNTLICANVNEHMSSLRVSLKFIDVDSGKPSFERPNFYEPGLLDSYQYYSLAAKAMTGSAIMSVAASPDSRYIIVVSGTQSFAFDMANRQPVPLKGKLKNLQQVRMTFLGSDRIVFVGELKEKGMVQLLTVSFPDGQLIKEGELGNQHFEAATKGPYIVISPLQEHNVGLYDVEQSKLIQVSNSPSLDAWENFIALENSAGGLGVARTDKPEIQKIPLPIGPLPSPRAAVFSPDGKYLAVSIKKRAQVWDLATGKSIALMRPFLTAWVDEKDQFFGQFQKFNNSDPAEMEFDISPFTAKTLAKLDDDEWQYHDFEMRLKPMGKDKATNQHATLEVKKMETQTVAWTRDYPHETPACWSAEDDRLVLAWDLSNDTAKLELKAYPQLQQEVEALKDKKKGILIETVKSETGEPLQQVVIPEADLTGGSRDVRRARVSGDYVLAQGEHGNTDIYRLDTGAKIGEFFGFVRATDAASGLVAAINRDEEVLIVEMATGKELQRFSLGSPVKAARIVTGSEKSLLVLTADQIVHRLPLPK